MDFHPNWVALATVDFEHRIFIKEQNKNDDPPPPKKSYQVLGTLNGDEAQNYYLETISAPETPLIETKPVASKISPIKTETQLQNRIEASQEPKNSSNNTCDLNERITNSFLLAAQENHVQKLEELLRKCPKVLNSTDDFGWTALMCAVKSSSLEAASFLLHHKADPLIRDKRGRSAFSLCDGREPIASLLKHFVVPKRSNNRSSQRQPVVELFCDICRENYNEKDKKSHFTSTLHVFNANRDKKIKTYYGIPESNRGYQILLRTGWDRDRGLGPSGHGNKYPIKTAHKLDRFGIGIEANTPRVTHRPQTNKKYPRIERSRTINKKYRDHINLREKCIERHLRRELS